MDLFEVTANRAVPSVHALLIEPFKTIWEQDESVNKERSLKIFSYVELLCSPKKSNPFYGIPIDFRVQDVSIEVWGEKGYPKEEEGILIEAVKKYREVLEHSSPSYILLDSALAATEQVQKFLNSLDMTERLRSGGLVFKPSEVSKAVKEMTEHSKAIEGLRVKVQQELLETSRVRNERPIGDFER